MGLRQLKKDRTRTEIRETARRLFLKKGFEKTRIRDIADRLQISEQTVFKYFPSKRAIVEALAEEWVAANARSAAEQRKPPAGASVLEIGRRNFAQYLDGLASQRDFLRLLLDHSSLGTLQPSHRPASAQDSGLLRGTRAQIEAQAQGYRLAQLTGELRNDADPRELAEMVMSITGTCLRTWVDTEPPPDLVELAFRRIGLLMRGARTGAPNDVKRAVAEARRKE